MSDLENTENVQPEVTSEPSSSTPIESGSEGSVQTSEPAYTPNYKFVVRDEEKEFPEWIRGVVKNPDIEKSVREIMEKAEGLPYVKERRDYLENENKTLRTQYTPIVKSAEQLAGYLKNKDYKSFFDFAGIPQQELFKFVYDELQLSENPQQLQARDQLRAQQAQMRELEERYQEAQQQTEMMAAERLTWELRSEMSKPEISELVSQFDAAAGKAGAFEAEVRRRGSYYYKEHGQVVPPADVVSEVANLLKWQRNANQPQSPQATPSRRIVPTLPNIKGGNTSPAKVVPKSLDDLRKLAKQMK